MKIYFLSSIPCALSVNGAFFGRTDGFERFAEVSLKDNLFIQFTPENALPLSFFLTEEIRFSPPSGVEVYLLPDAIALYAREFSPIDFTLKLIAQKRFDDALVSVFFQGGVHLCVQTEQNVFTFPLPPSFCQCELFQADDFFLLRSPTQLAVFHVSGKRVLLERALEYTLNGNELTAVLPLSDSLQRTAECKWLLTDCSATTLSFTLRQAYTQSQEKQASQIAEELLPFAFLESVLLGVEDTAMLSEELLDGKEKIKDFLGEFVAVTLTPDVNTYGLVYPKGERLFEVKYVSIETENGKITEIRC